MSRVDVPQSGWFEGGVHYLPVRVYWAETDIGGVMHHANYVIYMERGRSEFLRLVHLDQRSLVDEPTAKDLIWVIRAINLDYRKSAFLDDIVVIETRIEELAGASLTMSQVIRRGDDILMQGHVKAAFIDKNGRPQRMPTLFKARLAAAGFV